MTQPNNERRVLRKKRSHDSPEIQSHQKISITGFELNYAANTTIKNMTGINKAN